MTVIHPAAVNGGSSPGAINFGGNKHPIDADGEIDCPPDVEDALADHLAEHYGVSRGDIYEEDGPPDAIDVEYVEKLGNEVIEQRIADGECPWCDEYEGDAVGQHAASAHPDAWDGYKED